jgi:vanadium chloroperoxidase
MMLILPKVEEEAGLNGFPVFYWNHVALEMNRITHSLGGPQTGPTMSSRALGLLHLAMHDAYFRALGHDGTHATLPTYLPFPVDGTDAPGAGWDRTHADQALTAAAITVLDFLYRGKGPNISVAAHDTLQAALTKMIADFGPYLETLHPTFRFGRKIAEAILARLAVKAGEPGADQGHYEPREGRYYFRDEPVNPVRRAPIDPEHPERGDKALRIYHGPYYGTTVKSFAVTSDDHNLAPPPEGNAEYQAALEEVVALGGAPDLRSTTRTPDQTVSGLFWAYDGANLIGTPPRLYNQIIRKIAWERRAAAGDEAAQNAVFVRVLALINTAMADAGKFSWRSKYQYEFWRPLTGVREHDGASGPAPQAGHETLDPGADPFWRTLGAPETNTDKVSFKPPFPAYPSGHATFGAACFQIARLFYTDGQIGNQPNDGIAFDFVSEELNGVNRDLRQPYNPAIPIEDQPGIVRTRIVRRFSSLWHAIFDNAFSRIYLGVHWSFDAFDSADVLVPGTRQHRPLDQIAYSNIWPRAAGANLPIGGVPLGIGIANDIWGNRMREPAPAAAMAPVEPFSLDIKSSNTNIR